MTRSTATDTRRRSTDLGDDFSSTLVIFETGGEREIRERNEAGEIVGFFRVFSLIRVFRALSSPFRGYSLNTLTPLRISIPGVPFG
jgi:hypothetical protein